MKHSFLHTNKQLIRIIAVVLLCTFFNVATYAQPKPKTRILFVLDASGSMFARMETDTRINVAKKLLNKLMDSLALAKDVEVALRVYGHTVSPSRYDCKDTKLEVPFKPNNHQEIKDKVKTITPRGTTLIAYSLQMSAGDFPPDPKVRNVIILITDGIEECQGDPCAVSEALQSRGVVLKPFIIGLGSTDDFRRAFECVGRYFDANTEESFENVLNVVISQAMNNTTIQVNLLDAFSRPTETNVNMSFYDRHSGQLLYNYMHTMNEKGKPDTLSLDPIYKYKMVVHTIPPVVKDQIEIIAGKHNTIGVDVPQGNLQVKINGQTNYVDLKTIVRLPKDPAILHVQDANISERYLAGKYDVEILTIPRTVIRGVEITHDKTTTLELPQPGKLITFSLNQQYYADIYQMHRNELVWITKYNIETRTSQLVMQPGKYKIIYRLKGSYRSNQTFEREFEIKSASATHINF